MAARLPGRHVHLSFEDGALVDVSSAGVEVHYYDTTVARSLQQEAFAVMPLEFQAIVMASLGRENRRRYARETPAPASLLVLYVEGGVRLMQLGTLVVHVGIDGTQQPAAVERLRRFPGKMSKIA